MPGRTGFAAPRVATYRTITRYMLPLFAVAPDFNEEAVRLFVANNSALIERMTAEISRYLKQMGVDEEVWLRALETPPERITYFSTGDLVALKLVTKLAK